MKIVATDFDSDDRSRLRSGLAEMELGLDQFIEHYSRRVQQDLPERREMQAIAGAVEDIRTGEPFHCTQPIAERRLADAQGESRKAVR